ncbi:Cyclin-U2-1 [Ceratocystis fimbriata CBS 114723]|uniref:Cyclin-U2-1 n=1 Tax=Ceratocystis fimbriata CBS 114723 TaxID=1035309 RepID=A0A2C5XHF7_9PEZI|nr:Cyclin-U2-1 [Ceratocystis fimbriata CBS 114723]
MIAVNEVAVLVPPPAPVPSQDPFVIPLRAAEAAAATTASPLASPLTPMSPPVPKPAGPLQMKPLLALELLTDVVEMLLHNHEDIPPSPHDPTATMTNMRGMEAEKVHIIRSNSERDLARMRQLALKDEQTVQGHSQQKKEEQQQQQQQQQRLQRPQSSGADKGQLQGAQAQPQLQPQPPATGDPPLDVPMPHPFSAQHNAVTRRFYSKHPPQITAREYLQRLHKYCTHSSGVYIWTALTLFRLARTEGTMQVTPRNVHRLLLAALDVASKALEDHSWPHARIAQVGGVKNGELTRLEVSFCFLSNFELQTTTERMVDGLIEIQRALEYWKTDGGNERWGNGVRDMAT